MPRRAQNRYFPFNRLIDQDPETRELLARLAHDVLTLGRPIWIIANNKAEGSAPLSLLALYDVLLKLLETDQVKSPV